jgi:hypothetical protein
MVCRERTMRFQPEELEELLELLERQRDYWKVYIA